MSSAPSAATGATASTRDRVLAFMRLVVRRTADELSPIEAGWVARTPSLPSVWSVNQLRVTEPLGFEAVLELADAALAGLSYQQIAVEHQDAGPALEDEFRGAGWKVDREVLMVLSARPDREADTSMVVGAGELEVIEVMKRWHSEDRVVSADEMAQLTEFSQREARACGDRLFGVRSSDGQLVAITKLRSAGSTAQVEDVYTVPEARGRGFGRGLVTHAVAMAREAGHEMIFIEADDNDWPKQLYRQVGFRPVGHLWQFHHD
jgi:GNAT superfamily N-acetyltransferase